MKISPETFWFRDHHFPQLDHWKVNVLATDLSEKMIASAYRKTWMSFSIGKFKLL